MGLMNKDVKEIKDRIKNRQEYFNPVYLAIKSEEIDTLLYYINQLEEELKYTIPIVEHNKIVSEKLKENKLLKEEIRILKEHPFLSKEAFKKLKITTLERGKDGCNE